MATRWYTGLVTEIQPLTEFTSQFKMSIELEVGETFSFLPGQFVTFDLPIGEKRLQRWRSYSIANAPDNSNILEFCIVQSEGGAATQYLFDTIQVGSEIKFKGPDGVFVVPQDLASQEIIMLCTGTGIAPFRSMWQYIDQNQIPFKKIHLIFGTRYEDTILYEDELKAMKAKYSNFDYDIVLSRAHISGYQHGYIHDAYMSLYANVIEDRKFYICGWSGMIDQTMDNLINKLGYQKSQVKNELYG
ncbi:MAG: FAD-dependent oxidoreductase [Chitinophagales bacterium]|nr:FAD-dependent oxidoreductase [Chitinophagales bacterium]